ncbi:MAG TPA: ABC transporter ATP-binding protein [Dehalococcoidia bacterium]|nr:ABC transporter ATP-binding protein [Dehalococcoidia bacterium]
MQPAIELANVSKYYGNVLALDSVSLSVAQGEVCGFLGPNGAGKTTAIRLLFDLIRPSSGTARVLGLDCQREGLEARRQMGYLPGELRLYESYTGKQLISLFASIKRDPSCQSYAGELCERLELDAGQKVGSYSKGNKQKLGLILSLMHRPRVMVLDEPTSGLDPLVQEQVEQILAELAAEGHTVFFSSHVLSEVEQMCHSVAILRKGRLVAVESVANLKGRSLHILEVTFAEPVPAGAFELPGIDELRRDGNLVHLQVRSHLDDAIKAVARYPVVDLRTEQPSLEEVFLAYYQDTAPAVGASEGTNAAS